MMCKIYQKNFENRGHSIMDYGAAAMAMKAAQPLHSMRTGRPL